MIFPKANLARDIFEKEKLKQAPTRDGYGEGLVLAAEANENIVALCADLTESTRAEDFAKKFPGRFFEVGVAEQAMATIAAGLGISGKVPFISSYATFSPGRNYEQIRTTIAYNDSNVKIAGHHSGVSTGPDGATHQATEDIAIMRAMPNMRVVAPCDATEAKKATLAAAQVWGPVYLRFAREKSPVFTTEQSPFTFGKAEIFWHSKKPVCAIIACGPIVYSAIEAARDLEKEKIGLIVINNHTVKPLDIKTILDIGRRTGAIVAAEEHQIAGGLGGALAEVFAKNKPLPIEFIGMEDVFGESGPPSALIEKYGMSPKKIKLAVKKAIKRK